MKFTKSRTVGVILLIVFLASLTLSVFGLLAPRNGTPLHRQYLESQAEENAVERVNTSLSSAEDAINRAEKRVQAALSESLACLSAAKEAENTQSSGVYDDTTDIGQLANAISDAQTAGADMSEVIDSLAPVVNAALVEQLETAKTTVKRAETAVQEVKTTLSSLLDAACALELPVDCPTLPDVAAAEVPKLGDLTGVARLTTRSQNYLTRSNAAQAQFETLVPLGAQILSQARDALSRYRQPPVDRAMRFLTARALDLIVFSALGFAASLLLVLLPRQLHRWFQLSLFRKGGLFLACVALLAAALHYAQGDTWALMRQGVIDTLTMTIPSTFFAYVVGLPLGVLLVITAPGHIRPHPTFHSVLGTIINFLRSIPFLILLVLLFDVTRAVMGTAIGTRAVIFPLFVSAFPFVSRVVEGSINEVDRGVIEAAESMGSTAWQIVRKVLIPEALPSLVNGAALCMTTILAYTTMAGSAGGDGLGKIAITYGLNYRDYNVMYISSLLLVMLVQLIQIAGSILTRALDHRKK